MFLTMKGEVLMVKRRIVGIIGVGHVGAHVAYSIAVQGIADELILVDIDNNKAESECQDIFDSVAFLPHRIYIRVGDYADLGNCDILINAVGNISLLSDSNGRLAEMDYTISAVNGFVNKIMASGFHGIVISISNPCDIVASQFAKLANLPKGHVFGTGTALDTARLRSVLAHQTGIDHKSICAYVLGEHGIAQMVPWSLVSFGGKPLFDCKNIGERFCFDLEDARIKARDSWRVLMNGKRSTEYGICSTAARLVHIILLDEKQIIPVSTKLDGEYGERELFVGVPCVIGADGAEQVIEIPMLQEELEKFHECCEKIRKNMTVLKN